MLQASPRGPACVVVGGLVWGLGRVPGLGAEIDVNPPRSGGVYAAPGLTRQLGRRALHRSRYSAKERSQCSD